MSKVFWFIFVPILALASVLLIVFYFLYSDLGFQGYIDAVKGIYAVPSGNRAKFINEFYGLPTDPIQGGVYAGNFNGKYYYWGRNGLSAIPTSGESAFSLYQGCSGNSNVEKQVFFNISEWIDKLKSGDYITIYTKEAAPNPVYEYFGYAGGRFSLQGIIYECQK